MSTRLAWGATDLIPEHAVAAWGARAVIGDLLTLSVPSDRVDAHGSPEARKVLAAKLREVDPVALAQQQLRNGLEPGVCTVELYRDDTFAAAGRLSCGYFYISAWLVAQ